MKSTSKNCCILITAGFAEKSVSQAINILQTLHIEPTFLHLFVSPLMDDLLANYGVGSTLIGDTAYSPLPDGLLFAGGPICASHFLIDPRVYQFAEQMYEATKPVGYLYPVSTRLVEQLRPSHMSKPLLLQERLRIDQFLHNFSQRMRLPIPLSYQQLASLPVL